MEIIHVVLGKANPERMNGVNKVVYQLASRQQMAGKKVSVWGITPSPDHNYGNRSFTTKLFKAASNPFKIDLSMVNEFKQVKGNVVVHLHGGWIPVFYTLSSHLTRIGIPFVLTPHGAYNKIAMKRSKLRKFLYFYFFEKELIRHAKIIHCIGRSEVDGLHEIFPAKKSFLLPYGFESPTNLLEWKPVIRNFVLGYVGRLDIHTKGLDLLLKAFLKFKENHPISKLWIIGDGRERSKLEKYIVTRSLDSSVILWGSKFGDDKINLMSKMDVFVHPSRNEGMPSAVLEAAALGVPCVVSEATNIGQYVQQYNAGMVVPNESIEALADAFKKMFNEKNNKTSHIQSQGSRTMVNEAFNWNRIVEQFDSLYKVV